MANEKMYAAGYVEKKYHTAFKIIASEMGKTVSQLIRELVIATTEDRIKITPIKTNRYMSLYSHHGKKHADN